MSLKKLPPVALLIIVFICVAFFAVGFGLIDSEYSRLLPLPAVGGLIAVFLIIRKKKKSKIETYYDAVIACMAENEKGILGHPNDNLRLKPLKLITKQPAEKGAIAYSFKLPAGMSKSQYERYREGLEQYLNKNVSFSFKKDLIITVMADPLIKYK